MEKTIEEIQDEYFEKRKVLISNAFKHQQQEKYDQEIKKLNEEEDAKIAECLKKQKAVG